MDASVHSSSTSNKATFQDQGSIRMPTVTISCLPGLVDAITMILHPCLRVINATELLTTSMQCSTNLQMPKVFYELLRLLLKPEVSESIEISRTIGMDDTMTPLQTTTGLYGYVKNVDNLVTLDLHDNQSRILFHKSHPSKCDECEQRHAQVTCNECGLVYCAKCDTYRHRKGKLQMHLREKLTQKRCETLKVDEGSNNSVATWKVCDVCDWLEVHDLEVFVNEAQRQSITGDLLLSLDGVDKILNASTGASRGHKKKLQREVCKLQHSIQHSPIEGKTVPEPVPSPPIHPDTNLMQHIKFDLRVDVEPVVTKPRRSPVGVNSLGFSSLKIDMNDDDCIAIVSPKLTKDKRQHSRGLEVDIAQIKQTEAKITTASFDFSATGRLQTQGFEIDTRGIANVPFANLQQWEAHGKKSVLTASTVSSKDYLLLLKELGHGAGGKVYKALYMPTFMLVAVKVIRVYDKKKRHQMVRELQSLYVNYMPLSMFSSPSTAAAASSAPQVACKELVVFYDAYTNPETGSVSIVLEYMDEGSLEDYMQSVIESNEENMGCLSEKQIANVAACGLKGLAFLHKHHLLHRDIKLSNMLINHQGQVKISDFGISRDLESTLAKATTFTGTLLYMAPERISGGTYSYPSDLWSFGLAIMTCAIGKLPVPTSDGYWGVVHAVQEQPSPRLQDYGNHFSPELCDFLDQCLHKNPLYRPPAATLLEHPFITKNYSLKEQANVCLDRERQPLTAKALEHNRQEMKIIAEKAQSWCQDHADAFQRLSYMIEENEAQCTSSRNKIEVLAKQLRLPLDEVALQFTFLDKYCK